MIKPTKYNILIEPTDTTRMKGNIEIPDLEKDATEGEVVAVGKDVEEVSKGDYVYFSTFSINGREIKENKRVKYVILAEKDILAIKK